MKMFWLLYLCFICILWACSNGDSLTQKNAFLAQKTLAEGSLFDSLSIDTSKYNQNKELVKTIKEADSVILISHTASGIGAEPIVEDNQINKKVLKEHLKITRKNRIRLIHILAKDNKGNSDYTTFCFFPHHAIIMFLNGKTSYINICFGCHNYQLSGRGEGYHQFDFQRWDELEAYFRGLGFKYELRKQ